ncbi:MAG: AAA family ATPase [Candidatus Paceibacterota bacterium]
MNNIFLPELKSIEIKNYTLYPHGLDYTHDFINGVNLIVGGNGMGKTTFVNIIKYGVIGHYKELFDYTRTYKGEKIEKRTPLPWDYFKSRGKNSVITENVDYVKIKFLINNTEFVVKRGLSNIELYSLSINGTLVTGDKISQQKYDQLFYNYHREKDIKEKEELLENLKNTLPYKYEKAFEEYSNMPFDNLIFIVNKVLFFGEDHKTV